MSDSWSLKGKRVWSYEDLEFEDGSDSYAGRYFETKEDAEKGKWSIQYCYIEETIEHLRLKLIEDCYNVFKERGQTISGYTFERIINKRFGVDSV